jgi:hypothetical protein
MVLLSSAKKFYYPPVKLEIPKEMKISSLVTASQKWVYFLNFPQNFGEWEFK